MPEVTKTPEEFCQMAIQQQFIVYRQKEQYDAEIKKLNDFIKPLTDMVVQQDKQISELMKDKECTAPEIVAKT